MRAIFIFLSLLAVPLAAQQSDALAPIESTAAASVGTSGSLARVMDSFLNLYAAETPIWRTEVTTKNATAESTCPEGMQKGRTEAGMWYFFRPKTSDLLTLDERRAVMRDKRFGPFLAQMRTLADGKTTPLPVGLREAAKANPSAVKENVPEIGRSELLSRLLTARRPPPDTVYFDISAEELVLPGRMVVGVDVTSQTP